MNMDAILDFIVEHYIWFIVGGVVLLLAIIGYASDKKKTAPADAKNKKKDDNNEENAIVQSDNQVAQDIPSVIPLTNNNYMTAENGINVDNTSFENQNVANDEFKLQDNSAPEFTPMYNMNSNDNVSYNAENNFDVNNASTSAPVDNVNVANEISDFNNENSEKFNVDIFNSIPENVIDNDSSNINEAPNEFINTSVDVNSNVMIGNNINMENTENTVFGSNENFDAVNVMPAFDIANPTDFSNANDINVQPAINNNVDLNESVISDGKTQSNGLNIYEQTNGFENSMKSNIVQEEQPLFTNDVTFDVPNYDTTNEPKIDLDTVLPADITIEQPASSEVLPINESTDVADNKTHNETAIGQSISIPNRFLYANVNDDIDIDTINNMKFSDSSDELTSSAKLEDTMQISYSKLKEMVQDIIDENERKNESATTDDNDKPVEKIELPASEPRKIQNVEQRDDEDDVWKF